MILIDTTVLVYAVGADHPLREPSRGLIDAIGEGTIDATTTIEVIQELSHVRARRRSRSDAIGLARDFIDLLSPLVRPGEADLQRGLDLFGASKRLSAFDTVLAATVLGADHISALISADKAFASVPGLRFVDLADRAALLALGAAAS